MTASSKSAILFDRAAAPAALSGSLCLGRCGLVGMPGLVASRRICSAVAECSTRRSSPIRSPRAFEALRPPSRLIIQQAQESILQRPVNATRRNNHAQSPHPYSSQQQRPLTTIPGVRLTRNDVNTQHTFADLWHDAGEQQDWVVETRRELHRTPELLFDEKQTAAKITQVLTALQVNFTTGWAKNTKRAELAAKGFVSGEGGTGIVAQIGSGKEPCVLLRADMTASPSTAWTRRGSRRRRQDAPRTTATRPCCRGRGRLKRRVGDQGTIRLSGSRRRRAAPAARMVEEGVLAWNRSQSRLGFHQWPFLPLGSIGGRPGPMLAATELFDIVVSGVGGHAAMCATSVT